VLFAAESGRMRYRRFRPELASDNGSQGTISPETAPMKFTVTLTQWDYLRAIRTIKRRSWMSIFTYGFFLVLPLLGFVALLFLPVPWAELPFNPWLMLAGPLFVLTLPLLWLLNIRLALRNNAAARGPQTIEVNESGLRFSGGLYQSELKWEAILEVVETRDDFLFYISNRFAYFLPKRAVSSSDELRELRFTLEDAVWE
jgi:hypothetical protein